MDLRFRNLLFHLNNFYFGCNVEPSLTASYLAACPQDGSMYCILSDSISGLGHGAAGQKGNKRYETEWQRPTSFLHSSHLPFSPPVSASVGSLLTKKVRFPIPVKKILLVTHKAAHPSHLGFSKFCVSLA